MRRTVTRYHYTYEHQLPDQWVGSFRRIISIFLLLIAFGLAVSAQNTYTSARSGNWSTPSTWTGAPGTPGPTDNVIILSGHTVRIATGSGESITSITIDQGGVLDMWNKRFSVSGNLIVNGTITSDNNAGKDLDFSGSIIGGSGVIALNTASSYFNISNDAEVVSSAELLMFAHVTVENGVTVTNNGAI